MEKNEEVKKKLAKFLLMVGKGQEVVVDKLNQTTTESKQPKKVVDKLTATQFIQAEILIVKKTRLTDLLKVFYLNQRSRKKDYFLLNSYQKPNVLPNLNIGSVRNVYLVSG